MRMSTQAALGALWELFLGISTRELRPKLPPSGVIPVPCQDELLGLGQTDVADEKADQPAIKETVVPVDDELRGLRHQERKIGGHLFIGLRIQPQDPNEVLRSGEMRSEE